MKRLLTTAAVLTLLCNSALAFDSSKFADASEEEVMVSFVIATTVAYKRCGGQLTAQQMAAIDKAIPQLGLLVLEWLPEIQARGCPEVIKGYETARQEFARKFAK